MGRKKQKQDEKAAEHSKRLKTNVNGQDNEPSKEAKGVDELKDKASYPSTANIEKEPASESKKTAALDPNSSDFENVIFQNQKDKETAVFYPSGLLEVENELRSNRKELSDIKEKLLAIDEFYLSVRGNLPFDSNRLHFVPPIYDYSKENEKKAFLSQLQKKEDQLQEEKRQLQEEKRQLQEKENHLLAQLKEEKNRLMKDGPSENETARSLVLENSEFYLEEMKNYKSIAGRLKDSKEVLKVVAIIKEIQSEEKGELPFCFIEGSSGMGKSQMAANLTAAGIDVHYFLTDKTDQEYY